MGDFVINLVSIRQFSRVRNEYKVEAVVIVLILGIIYDLIHLESLPLLHASYAGS